MKKASLLIAVVACVCVPRLVGAQGLSEVGSYSDDARAARIAELRLKYRISLSSEERDRLVSRCEAAQQNIQNIADRLDVSTATRTAVYENVITLLSNLRTLVVAESVDASNLELLIVDYQRAKTDFTISATAYQTALDDSLQIDCRAEPENFRASVEGIREGRRGTNDSANEIEELTRSNLKTAFDTLKIRLNANGAINGN